MATIKQNISNSQVIDQALAQYQSQNLGTASYLESYLGNIDLLNPTFTGASNTLVSGVLSNGDTFHFTGSNLLGYPSTLNSFSYSSATGVTLNASGALTVQDKTSASTGSLTTIAIQDSNTGISYSYQGNFTVNDMQINQMTVGTNDYMLTFTGDLRLDHNDMPVGTINSLSLTIDGQTNSIEGISLDINSLMQTSDYDSLLAQVMSGDDTITGGNGNDQLQGYDGNDAINGGAGNDTAIFNVNQAEVQSIRQLSNLDVEITTADGVDTLNSIEHLDFLDGTVSITSLLPEYIAPSSKMFSLSKGNTESAVVAAEYVGPVSYLEYQLIGDADGEVVIGTDGNDFINLQAGDDAANGGLGNDVLDGGLGSNFLSGGSGDDIFFLDGRSGENTWSTITDFSDGDQVNIWGWVEGTSQLHSVDPNAGAAGYEGATFHYDLNNDNVIDTSITFTGLSADDVQSSAHSVQGNGYLLMT